MIFPVLVLVPGAIVLIFGTAYFIRYFRLRTVKPTPGEILVAVLAGLLAAVFAGVMGGIAAIFACSRLLTGEMGEWALVFGPAAALLSAALAFVSVFRWFLTYGDSPSETV
ncbi:MAG TPA: hypothetical protein VFE06_03610 [Acidobacteriaceae bacterium]|jgi:hypothetical protein|nr:hypothetical protein [Acidobacteriaceae bacterium]